MSELSQHLSASKIAGIPVRVSIEIGRSSYPLAQAVSLDAGQVVALDSPAQAPAEVYVDGMLYARGRLSSVDGRWALKMEEVLVESSPDFLDSLTSAQLEEDTAELEQ